MNHIEEAPRYKRLSVLVPVFNERVTVAEILRRMRRVVLPLEMEIIVVNDGSTDGTDKVLAALEDSTVMVVTHGENRGKGACIRTALEHAHGDLVLIQDADLEYDPQDWPALLSPMLAGRARVVYGSRFLGERQTMSFTRHIGNRLVSLAADVLYNTNLSDIQTCYKVFDRSVLDGLRIESDGFGFEPEITAKVLRAGFRVYEVPISFASRNHDEGMKFTRSDTARALGTLVKYRFRRELQ